MKVGKGVGAGAATCITCVGERRAYRPVGQHLSTRSQTPAAHTPADPDVMLRVAGLLRLQCRLYVDEGVDIRAATCSSVAFASTQY